MVFELPLWLFSHLATSSYIMSERLKAHSSWFWLFHTFSAAFTLASNCKILLLVLEKELHFDMQQIVRQINRQIDEKSSHGKQNFLNRMLSNFCIKIQWPFVNQCVLYLFQFILFLLKSKFRGSPHFETFRCHRWSNTKKKSFFEPLTLQRRKKGAIDSFINFLPSKWCI